jgi:uncharacterized protein YecE (DUF72 family)
VATPSGGQLYVGCAVWAYDGWANRFFPPGLPKDERLRSYGKRLAAVEVNSTFYAVPALDVVKRWAADTPAEFRFCPKFPKAISHSARLSGVAAQTATFLGTMRVLGPRLGPLMLQLSPTFAPSGLPLLRDYLKALPADLKIGVEVRHLDWFKPGPASALAQTLADLHMSRIIFDSRPIYASNAPAAISARDKKPGLPLVAEVNQNFVILRYISSPIVPENDSYLTTWATQTNQWLTEGRDVYFFAHCPVEEEAPGIARDFHQRLRALRPLPPLAWDQVESTAPHIRLEQNSLF